MSKITKLPFKKFSSRQTTRLLEIVHSDVCRPMTPSTYDNKKYFVPFLDDFTHFTVVYLVEHKSEVFECFKKYEAFVSAKFSVKL